MLRIGKIEASGGFLLLGAALLYLDTQGIFPWAMLACAVHEFGHYAAVKLLGGRLLRLRLTVMGGEMQLSPRYPLSYGRELAAVLAGPAANLAAVFLAVSPAGGGGETAWLFAGLNLAIGCFNLLPADPLDGGYALKLLLSVLLSPQAAERAAHMLSCITALLMLAAGVALLYKTRYNFTLLIVAIWILLSALRPQRR